MNTTTFTIESVHGVKQTFVLGPGTEKSAENEAGLKQTPAQAERETGKAPGDAHTPR